MLEIKLRVLVSFQHTTKTPKPDTRPGFGQILPRYGGDGRECLVARPKIRIVHDTRRDQDQQVGAAFTTRIDGE